MAPVSRIDVLTKDCTALSDADLAEMGDLNRDEDNRFEIGVLSKQAESWVLVTLAREAEELKGYSFCTLERIGGTPSVLIGLCSVQRCGQSDELLEAIIADQMRRAVLAFPDEDVLVGARFNQSSALHAYRTLHDIVPRPGHKANGEERAWGRRLAKRFGIEAANYHDRSFVARGDGSVACIVDYHAAAGSPNEVAELFDPLDHKAGDVLIAFGWAMAEDLALFAP
ncbi:MAG: hypothetical protein ACKVWR_16220 [Acidimicrobiales bacterium]